MIPSSLTDHGGRLDEAARRFPVAPQPWLDLSTGINPVPCPAGAAAGADLAALPSPTALARLEAAAAQAFGLRHGAIVALPGSEIGLRLLAALGLPAPWRIVSPCYAGHAAALPGADPVAFEKAARGPGTLLLANPGNPDGRLTDPAALLRLAGDGWLVVDEAFADAHAGAGVLPLLAPGDRVLVLRSFGKFYGLAGVRLGFVCGEPAMVGRLRAMVGDWPVSATALAVGEAAYRDDAWRAAARERLTAAAAALDAVLRRHGLVPRGDSPLFRLVETPAAGAVFERLARRGILTRPFADRPNWLRIGLPGDDAGLARLDRALGER